MARLDLVSLRREPLEVVFPNGRVLPARSFTAEEWALYKRLQEKPDAETATALLKACVPDATDAEWGTLDEDGVMAMAILAYCAGKLKTVLEHLGNVQAGQAGAARPTRRSGPRTTKGTSATRSRTPTGATSGRSGTRRST